jgi:hypothetical protein
VSQLLDEDQLLHFETLLRRHDVPLDEWTNPGLSDVDIDLATSSLGLPLPREARVWWRWRNGTIHGGRRKLPAPWHEALSVSDAIDQYRRCRQVAKNTAPDWPHNNPDLIWNPSWLPIINTTQPIAIDCSVPEDAPTPVLRVDWSDIEHSSRPRAASLGEMVGWWIVALDTGAWYWNEKDGWWRVRAERLDPALRTNPLL